MRLDQLDRQAPVIPLLGPNVRKLAQPPVSARPRRASRGAAGAVSCDQGQAVLAQHTDVQLNDPHPAGSRPPAWSPHAIGPQTSAATLRPSPCPPHSDSSSQRGLRSPVTRPCRNSPRRRRCLANHRPPRRHPASRHGGAPPRCSLPKALRSSFCSSSATLTGRAVLRDLSTVPPLSLVISPARTSFSRAAEQRGRQRPRRLCPPHRLAGDAACRSRCRAAS